MPHRDQVGHSISIAATPTDLKLTCMIQGMCQRLHRGKVEQKSMGRAALSRPAPRSPSCNPRASRLPLVQGMRKVYRDECQSGLEYMRSRNTLIVVCFSAYPVQAAVVTFWDYKLGGTCSRVTLCHPLRSSLQPHLTTTQDDDTTLLVQPLWEGQF